jgi:hypothetical protein
MNGFTREGWESHVEEERQEPSAPMRLFLKIKEQAEKNPDLADVLSWVEADIIRYQRSVASRLLEQSKGIQRKNKDYENTDEAQRNTHEALMADLDILSREFAKFGLDNKWRIMIGSSRDQVANWALTVAPYLRKDVLSEKGE